MPELVFLGGPPAVGKSTVAPLLAKSLGDCAWLDGDDVWRMSLFASPTDAARLPRRG